MALPEDVICWLDETADSSDPLDVFTITSRLIAHLHDRGATEAEIKSTVRILAPLEFFTRRPTGGPWNSYFAPRRTATDGDGEYPCLADFSADDVEEWANLATVLKRPIVRARFADAVWELGKQLKSSGKDLHCFARLAAEMYLEAAASTDTTARSAFSMLEAVTRGICLSMQLRVPSLVERGFDRIMAFADSVELAHIGLWTAPFDRLIGLNGLSKTQRQQILDKYEIRLRATIANRDLFRIMMTGSPFAKYFYDRKNYERAKAITLYYGEVVLDIATSLDASLASHHIANVLEAYRRVGLREEAERVRLLLEAKGKDVVATLKSRRFEFKLDRKEIEDSIAKILNVPHPLVALYRLANCCAPLPAAVEKRLDGGEFIAHRLVPVAILGDNGLTVSEIGTYDQDTEGHIVMGLAQEMNLSMMYFLIGLEEWKKKFELGGVPDTPNILDCALVPADRVSLYRDGLQAFECEDYVKCIHVLVPQVENSLRELLKMLGKPATKTDEDGGFQLKNMYDVLNDPLVRETLEEKLWYFLKVLYVDNRGMNLRNLVVHGIAPVEAFNRANAALVIQSIVFLTMIRDEALSVSEEDTTANESSSENVG
jgi:lysyl-tRNA synthetase class 1